MQNNTNDLMLKILKLEKKIFIFRILFLLLFCFISILFYLVIVPPDKIVIKNKGFNTEMILDDHALIFYKNGKQLAYFADGSLQLHQNNGEAYFLIGYQSENPGITLKNNNSSFTMGIFDNEPSLLFLKNNREIRMKINSNN